MILKEILKDYLPNSLITKSKAGFAIPIDNLLRTKLKFWVEEILQNSEKTNEIINYKNVKYIWDQHKKKKINAGGILWSILILQNWFNSIQQ
jgi:asparagine synthase (glutamine-hydrolysing)